MLQLRIRNPPPKVIIKAPILEVSLEGPGQVLTTHSSGGGPSFPCPHLYMNFS